MHLYRAVLRTTNRSYKFKL